VALRELVTFGRLSNSSSESELTPVRSIRSTYWLNVHIKNCLHEVNTKECYIDILHMHICTIMYMCIVSHTVGICK